MTVLFDVADHVATITLNRPEKLNSFNEKMTREIAGLWQRVRDDDSIHVAVVRAAGDRAFCTGIDVSEGPWWSDQNEWNQEDPGVLLGPKQHRVWKPVITAVHGMAAGGAMYFINESDIVICSDDATFFDPHANGGMVSALEPVGMLRRGVPLGDVMRWALLGNEEQITAATALRLGLVTEVVPRDSLWATAASLAAEIASRRPEAIQGTVRAIWEAIDEPWVVSQRHGLAYTQLGNRGRPNTPLADRERRERRFRLDRNQYPERSRLSLSPTGCQEDAAGYGAAAGGRDGDLGAGYLAGACGAAQLEDGLVDDPVAVHAPGRELAAVGVERQFAVEGDALPALDEGACLAVAAQAEGLEPGEREEREPVVELGDVDIARREAGAAPHLRRRVGRGHLGVVGPLVPASLAGRPADRRDPDGRVRAVTGPVGRGDHQGDGAVDRNIAVEQAQRVRDGPGREVVVKGDRLLVHGGWIEGGVPAAVDGQPPELLLGRPVQVHVPSAVHSEPVDGRVGVHREQRAHPVGREARRGLLLGLRRRASPGGGRLREDRSAHHLHRTVDEDVAGLPGPDGDERRHQGREQAAGVEPAAPPGRVDAQGAGRLADRRVAHRGDPVDVGRPQSGVRDRRARGGSGQVDSGDAGPAADRRHAHAGDAGTLLDAGVKNCHVLTIQSTWSILPV
jgi:E-phenylitaconyl-CoA hydratase